MIDQMTVRALRRILNQPLVLRLFVSYNGVEIVEASGGGYSARTLTIMDWTITPGATAVAEGPLHTFRFDGSKRIEIAGAFLTEDTGPLWIKGFDEALAVRRRGDEIPVKPVYRLGVIS